MNKKLILILFIFLLAFGGFYFWRSKTGVRPDLVTSRELKTNDLNPTESGQKNEAPKPEIIAENLDTPWGIVFLPASPAGGPDGKILVTERPGRIRLADPQVKTEAKIIWTLSGVKEIGEGGLLGIALHPNFASDNFVYVYYTYSGDDDSTLNKVVRMSYRDEKFGDEELIVDRIPGAPNHNGGRIKFGPDGFLYITTGDAQNPSKAQDRNSLSGKILRVSANGDPAPGNPFDNLIYSYGHRNPQGLAWDNQGRLWAAEHGRSGAMSGLDEINLIEPGKNYGWPEIQGDEARSDMVSPKIHSGSDTWAPSGLAVSGNRIFFAGLRGEALYEAEISGDRVINLRENFKDELGRLREVITGPDGALYFTTSNQDGRGNPASGDDKIFRINL